jgi:hypothetical protein
MSLISKEFFMKKHHLQRGHFSVPDAAEMIESIQESLCKDFRDHLRSLGCIPRRTIDTIYQYLRHRPVAGLAEDTKAFSKALASEPTGGEYTELVGAPLWLSSDPALIASTRQVLGFFSRMHANVSRDVQKAQLAEAMDRLERPADIHLTIGEIVRARRFIARVLGPAPSLTELRFRHGPGAVATGEKGLGKIYFRETYEKVDQYLGYDSECLFRLPNQPPLALERVVPTTRVIAVPKDALKIRTISAEPLSMQFLQQGVMLEMYFRLARNAGEYFPLTDTSVSRRLAREGSTPSSRGLRTQPCTLDLSNASDDVKARHVELLFPADWAKLLLTLRSEVAYCPELQRSANMQTFAPMGAATCYPVESLVFASLAIAAAGKEHVRKGGLLACVGDDVITPAANYYSTIDVFVRAGFTPNLSKCCGPTVRFRESCGGDYYDGYEVTFERPRILPKFGSRQASVPTVQLANGLYQRGFPTAAQLLANTVRTPVALGDGNAYANPALNWPCVGKYRFNRDLQRSEQQAAVEIPLRATPLGAVDGWEPLFTWFTSGWNAETNFPTRTKTRIRWLPCGG